LSKRILIVLSDWGYWGEEPVGPLEQGLRHRGFHTDEA
jgi:hypothetical protein